MRRRLLSPVVALVWVLGSFLSAAGAHDQAPVVRVVDGDTLDVTLNGQSERVRLIGIDTPEVYNTRSCTVMLSEPSGMWQLSGLWGSGPLPS